MTLKDWEELLRVGRVEFYRFEGIYLARFKSPSNWSRSKEIGWIKKDSESGRWIAAFRLRSADEERTHKDELARKMCLGSFETKGGAGAAILEASLARGRLAQMRETFLSPLENLAAEGL